MKKFILLITFLLFGNLCFAEPFQAPKIEEGEPLEIRSEKADIYRKRGEIHFMGNVMADQGEMKILSKKMIVKYTEDKNSKISINEIVVEGGTSLFTKTIKASGNSGFYDFKKGLVSLKGDVIANEQGAMAYGEEFIYNVNTRKTKLLGNKKSDDRVIIILDDVEETEKRIKESKENEDETK
jgi:lipopolysaccharide transport protein LptA